MYRERHFVKTIVAVVVEPDGTARRVEIQDTLDALQAVVGGDIEGIFMPFYTVYVNGEGMILNLPANPWIQGFLDWGYPICGTALIVGPPDHNGDDTDVPEFVFNYYNLEN